MGTRAGSSAGSAQRLAAWATAAAILATGATAVAEEGGFDGSGASRGSPLCSMLFGLALIAIYRGRGVGWGLSIGTAMVPGLFGWFVWRDRSLGFGIRLFALVSAILQLLVLCLGIAAAIAIPNYLRMQAARAGERDAPGPAEPAPVAQPDPDGSRALDATATITSRPAGARLFVDGMEEGVTPAQTRLKAGKPTTFRLELDGHLPQTKVLKASPGGSVDWAAELVAGGRLQVTSTPPGARVLVDGVVVLERTPGTTALLPPQSTEFVLALDGFVPVA